MYKFWMYYFDSLNNVGENPPLDINKCNNREREIVSDKDNFDFQIQGNKEKIKRLNDDRTKVYIIQFVSNKFVLNFPNFLATPYSMSIRTANYKD